MRGRPSSGLSRTLENVKDAQTARIKQLLAVKTPSYTHEENAHLNKVFA